MSGSNTGGDQKTYKINVLTDEDDPTFSTNNADLEEIPTDWTVKDRPAKEVIYEYIERGNELDAMDHNYRIKKWLVVLLCTLSSIVGILLIFLGTGYTVLFKNYEFNKDLVIGASILFLPVFVWIWYVFLPCGQLYKDRQAIMARRAKRDLELRKRDAYINNREFDEKIDDEFVFVDKQEEKLCDRFKSYSDLRGLNYDYAYQFEAQNGYTNNYYYKYFLFGHNEIMKKVRKKKLYTLDYKEPTYDMFKEIADYKNNKAKADHLQSGHFDSNNNNDNNDNNNNEHNDDDVEEGRVKRKKKMKDTRGDLANRPKKDIRKELESLKKKNQAIKTSPFVVIDARKVALQPPEWEVSGGKLGIGL